MKLRRIMFIATLITGCVICQRAVTLGQTNTSSTFTNDYTLTITGSTYLGESICVTKTNDCQNERLIIRFESVAGRDGVFDMFVDKLVKGARLPMFIQQVEYNKQSATLSKVGTGRLILSSANTYSIGSRGQTLTWTSSSSDGNIERRIKARQVAARSVPTGTPNRLLYKLL